MTSDFQLSIFNSQLLIYDLPDNVLAFTAGKGVQGTAYGVDARQTGVHTDTFHLPSDRIFIPRQTHSVNVCRATGPGEMPDTDAVITDVPDLCVAVKTADCIPVLLYDEAQRLVAAIHAGWRGTVGRIVERTIREMKSRGADLHAIIGPGISIDAFEVGDEVYDAFLQAGFPMQRIARRYPAKGTADTAHPTDNSPFSARLAASQPDCRRTSNFQFSKWHIDLWEANRWLLEQAGVERTHVASVCTFGQVDRFYSARQETIKTGRNINGIMLKH